MKTLYYPLQLLGWALGSVRPSWPPTLLLYSYHLHRRLTGQECDLSYLHPSKRALPCTPHLKEDEGIRGSPLPRAQHCMLGLGSYPSSPLPSPALLGCGR